MPLNCVTDTPLEMSATMNKPKVYATSNWQQSWLELVALYGLTSIAVAHLFQMHWTIAMSVSPVIMLVLLLSVIVLVEVLWFCVLALDKCGAALGIRKSPLV